MGKVSLNLKITMEITIKIPEAHVEMSKELKLSKEQLAEFIQTNIEMTILDEYELDEFQFALEDYLRQLKL